MDKIRALWLIAFPICIAIIVLIVVSLGYGDSAYGEGLVLIAVPTFFLFLIFTGTEDLLRPKKKDGN